MALAWHVANATGGTDACSCQLKVCAPIAYCIVSIKYQTFW